MTQKIIAIDLGGTSIKMAIISTEGEILQKWSIATNVLDNGVNIIPDIIKSIQERILMYNLSIEEFIGIGMGSPGIINTEEGTVDSAFNLNWHEPQLVKKQFNEVFSIPFIIDNDANVAALGEQWKGAGNSEANCVMVTLGTGVGGGIVNNYQLVHGSYGAAGEIGHITIDPTSTIQCTCGKNGCLESVASATGIVNLAREYSKVFSGDSLIKNMIDNGENVTSKEIFDSAKMGDNFSIKIVEQFSNYLGLACSHIANILNPSYIIIGGGVSQAGEFLIGKVRNYFKKYAFKQIGIDTKICLASLGNDAGILGAAQIVNLYVNGVEK